MINTLTLLAYALAWFLIVWHLRQRTQAQDNRQLLMAVKITWALAVFAHLFTLHAPLMGGGERLINISFAEALSQVAFWLSFLLLVSILYRRLESLGLFALPIITLSVLLAILYPNDATDTGLQLTGGLGIHIFSSLLAYSLFFLASLQALLLAYQNHHLHHHQQSTLLRTLPAIQDMEHFLFELIRFGLLVLSIALLTGFIYLDNMLEQHVAHKTLLSLLAWIVFSVLLVGRYRYGWRGKVAIRWTLSGFVLLMLAFLGTKFVLEFLITKS
ncbi:MAG: cytochrome C assembly family protein [bacterium]